MITHVNSSYVIFCKIRNAFFLKTKTWSDQGWVDFGRALGQMGLGQVQKPWARSRLAWARSICPPGVGAAVPLFLGILERNAPGQVHLTPLVWVVVPGGPG